MKQANILSVLQARRSLDAELFEAYKSIYKIGLKNKEIPDLEALVEALVSNKCGSVCFEGFYAGYKIPQISKEFDLLRFDEFSVVNIELKSRSCEKKILEQLKGNKYYLGFLAKKIDLFTFVSGSAQIYTLDSEDCLVSCKIDDLIHALSAQNFSKSNLDIDSLFDPSNYLVSPFNSTEKFLENKYFLTSHQEEIKKEIIKDLEANSGPKYYAITGSAGTGKTLLTYDLAREIRAQGFHLLIIHVANLNGGHWKLINKDWKINAIKDLEELNLKDYQVLIIDEAQRLQRKQFSDIKVCISEHGGACIFSYDKTQTLGRRETKGAVWKQIEDIDGIQLKSLTNKIRTNRSLANFIRAFLNNKTDHKTTGNEDVEVVYFKSMDDAKNYLYVLEASDYEVLQLTNSRFTFEKEFFYSYRVSWRNSSHEIIGQEFDRVALVIDEKFYYSCDGSLKYPTEGVHYEAEKMLYQNITRVRKRLSLVVVNNPAVLDRCTEILTSQS